MFLPNDPELLKRRPSVYRLPDIPWNRDDDDDLVEILRNYPREVRREMLAKLEEMHCRLDADLAERLDDDR